MTQKSFHSFLIRRFFLALLFFGLQAFSETKAAGSAFPASSAAAPTKQPGLIQKRIGGAVNKGSKMAKRAWEKLKGNPKTNNALEKLKKNGRKASQWLKEGSTARRQEKKGPSGAGAGTSGAENSRPSDVSPNFNPREGGGATNNSPYRSRG